jgi:YHS domain-containing protein
MEWRIVHRGCTGNAERQWAVESDQWAESGGYKVHGEWKKFPDGRVKKEIWNQEGERGQSLGGWERTERSLQRSKARQQNSPHGGIMATDPVCGMNVNERAELQTQFAGKKYFFCSEECRKEFEAEPDAYVETVAA